MSTAEANTEIPVESARDELQESVPKAAKTLSDLLDAEDERVQIQAAEVILNGAGLTKAQMQSSEIKAQVQVGGGERDRSGPVPSDPLEDADPDDLF